MLSGQTFRISAPTLGLWAFPTGKRVVETIPEYAMVYVVAPQEPGDRMIDVLYEGKRLAVFAQDLLERGEEVLELAS